MVQGAPKKAKTSANKPIRSKALGPRPGVKVIKAKNAKLIANNKMLKKARGGLTGATERLLAGKAGHLEMLAGGKRDKKKTMKIIPKKPVNTKTTTTS
jgi:hypothetical protein